MTQYNTSFEGTLPFSDQTVQIALAANTELTYTIPGDATMKYRCEFSWLYNSAVWVGYNTSATVPPPGAVTTTSNVSLELRPNIKFVKGGDVLHFISSSLVTDAGLMLLALPS